MNIVGLLQNQNVNIEKISYTFLIFLPRCAILYKYCCSIATMDSTNTGIYKSNGETEIMGAQQYCLRVAYVFMNLEGIFAKMAKMAKQH